MKFNIYIVNYYDYDETQFIGAYLFKKHAQKAADYNGGEIITVDLFKCYRELFNCNIYTYQAYFGSDDKFDIRKIPMDSHHLSIDEKGHTCGHDLFYFRTNMDPNQYLEQVIHNPVYKEFKENHDSYAYLELTESEGTVIVKKVKYEQIDTTN